jgi:hypothetical protein
VLREKLASSLKEDDLEALNDIVTLRSARDTMYGF